MMFCDQCEETFEGKGCTKVGMCGKSGEVAQLQDLLISVLAGISEKNIALKEKRSKEADAFIIKSLFSTITNANFDKGYFLSAIRDGLALKKKLSSRNTLSSEDGKWLDEDDDSLMVRAGKAGVKGEGDLRSLRELLLYGIKGISAYAEHALVLGKSDDRVSSFMQEGLVAVFSEDAGADRLQSLVMRCGEIGLVTMELLDRANTSRFGTPEPTRVQIGTGDRPGILVSGHDLLDLEELLIQTEGKGIDIYTHSEMLPAHSYPRLKKFSHLKGNYGGSWWRQGTEFESFNGPILLTTNCLIPPRASYKGRIFTTGASGFSGIPHLPDRKAGREKDFSPIIRQAKESRPPMELETGTIMGGFAHGTLAASLGTLIKLVEEGKIKRFIVMAGCDGRDNDRSYYTEFAKALPHDTIILTAGCAKYRYNKLNLGDIGGIPRVVDAGQCNDSYSLIFAAQALSKTLGVGINDLPISYNIAWYEQKAVLVLLSLLSLGVKDIRLGPKLPAFISPGVLNVLVDRFGIQKNSDVESDLRALVP